MKYITKIASINDDLSIATAFGSRFHYSVRSSKVRPITIVNNPSFEPSFSTSTLSLAGSTCVEDDILGTIDGSAVDLSSFAVIDNVGSYSTSFSPDFINVKPFIAYLSDSQLCALSKPSSYGSSYNTYAV